MMYLQREYNVWYNGSMKWIVWILDGEYRVEADTRALAISAGVESYLVAHPDSAHTRSLLRVCARTRKLFNLGGRITKLEVK